ncbi:MAG: ATP phosphoribosyltransferase regulatory subunit [Lachnospiraceae bacterium]|nr:ATP phosphoribosyltransferase regulatory subunit [Lachnospiraceae bacterium]
MQKILHTPEGVRDIYNKECEQKLELQKRLHTVIKSYGYRDIETPTFEFFDVFSREVGTTPSRELYKFFDHDGNTLVLRPDFTPPVARAASKYFLNDNMALRLTYLGNAFTNNSSYQGRLKETTQIGGELIGDDSADADAEVIALAVQLLLASGLKEFQISLGHCGYFDALVKEAGLDAPDVSELRELISNKNTFGAEKLLSRLEMSDSLRKSFIAIPGLFGSAEVLDKAEALTDNPEALVSIARLREIWEILKLYGVQDYVSFDLGLRSRYMYYTGILFRGYTFGTGAAILKGGRYDGLLAHFGKDAPAVGFVAEIDQLMLALSGQKLLPDISDDRCVIIYDEAHQAEAIRKAAGLRKSGTDAELVRVTEDRTADDCRNYAGALDCADIIELL